MSVMASGMSISITSLSIATVAPRWTAVFSGWNRRMAQREDFIHDLDYPNRNIIADRPVITTPMIRTIAPSVNGFRGVMVM